MSSRWMSKPPVGSVVDWGNPLAKGLVGAWLMNEGGGNKTSNLCLNSSGVIAGARWGVGKYSNYLNFTASSSSSVNSNFNKTSDFATFIFLAYSSSDTNNSRLFDKRVSGNQSELILRTATSNQIVYERTATSARQTYVTIPNFLNNWKWIAVTTNRNTLSSGVTKFYSNGVLLTPDLDGSGSGTLVDNTDNYVFGNRLTDSARVWTGYIGTVYIYNRILSPSEIQSLYESPYQFVKGPTTITYFTAPQAGGWTWGGEVKNVMVA